MKRRIMKRVLGFALVATAAIALLGQVVLQLWNWLMPAIFHLPRIGFWQALGLMVLSWIFFGGMRGMRTGRRHWRRANCAPGKLTPQQREQFRTRFEQRFENRCGPRRGPVQPQQV